jgi:hypothetical protein
VAPDFAEHLVPATFVGDKWFVRLPYAECVLIALLVYHPNLVAQRPKLSKSATAAPHLEKAAIDLL